jgi:hypothetical protein
MGAITPRRQHVRINSHLRARHSQGRIHSAASPASSAMVLMTNTSPEVLVRLGFVRAQKLAEGGRIAQRMKPSPNLGVALQALGAVT